MSVQLRQTVASTIEALQAMAKDMRRPLPADWTPEEADERAAQSLEQLAVQLQRALEESNA